MKLREMPRGLRALHLLELALLVATGGLLLTGRPWLALAVGLVWAILLPAMISRTRAEERGPRE